MKTLGKIFSPSVCFLRFELAASLPDSFADENEYVYNHKRMSIQSIESQIARLSRAEKAELLQLLAQEVGNAWAGIEKTAGVSGGAACIVRTRIPVWTLENYRRLGWTEAALLQNFPSLRAADLVNAWAYADSHAEEMNKVIQLNEAA